MDASVTLLRAPHREPQLLHDPLLQLEQAEPDTVCSTPLIPKTEGRRTTSVPPQPGQPTALESEKTSFSNSRPQALHRYS
jgi:hypothetical protein